MNLQLVACSEVIKQDSSMNDGPEDSWLGVKR